MKKALVIMALALLTLPAASAWQDSVTFGASYARSFQGHTAAAVLTVGIPVASWKLNPLVTAKLNVEVNAAATNTNEFQGGPGASITLEDQFVMLRLGLGYIPGDLGCCWNIGISKVVAKW